MVKLQLQ